MAQYFTLITAVGQAKIAAAVASGNALELTHMAVGDGNGIAVIPAEGQTALAREVYRATVSNLRLADSNPNWVLAELVIQASTGGWFVREAGIFDADGDLIAVSNFPDTYKPVLSEGSTRELVVRIVIEVSDTSSIKLTLDPSIVTASREWVADNFTVAKLLPGGASGKYLRKASDASGDMEWSDAADEINRAQVALANMRLMLNTEVTTGQLVQGHQWELLTDEWGAASIGFTYFGGAVPYYASNQKVAQVFNASGTFTVPAGVFEIDADVRGDGGGGGAAYTNSYGAGGGGGGGRTKKTKIPVTPGQEIAIVVGPGGKGGLAATCSAGSDGTGSSLGTMALAGGGKGGQQNTANSTAAAHVNGGAGGLGETENGEAGKSDSASGVNGNGGGGGKGAGADGGAGGPNGTPTQGVTATYNGAAGSAPGGGGAGASSQSSDYAAHSGGDGGRGEIIVEYAMYTDMTLAQPSPVPLVAEPEKATAFMLWLDESATAVPGVDLTVEFTRDGGATWTPAASYDLITSAAGFDGTYTCLRARAALASQGHGVNLSARIKTHNGKAQRVAAPSVYGH